MLNGSLINDGVYIADCFTRSDDMWPFRNKYKQTDVEADICSLNNKLNDMQDNIGRRIADILQRVKVLEVSSSLGARLGDVFQCAECGIASFDRPDGNITNVPDRNVCPKCMKLKKYTRRSER